MVVVDIVNAYSALIGHIEKPFDSVQRFALALGLARYRGRQHRTRERQKSSDMVSSHLAECYHTTALPTKNALTTWEAQDRDTKRSQSRDRVRARLLLYPPALSVVLAVG